MRQAWMIGVGLLIAGCKAASAQSGVIPPPNLTGQPPARADDRPLPQAPVGHRQPRAADLPPPQETRQSQETENARQDAVLDSKIKGICRGC